MPLRSWMCSGTTVIILRILLSTAWPPATTALALVIDQLQYRLLTILKHHGHRSTLVQDSELPLWTLFVRGIRKDTTIQQRSIGVSDHGSDISGAVRLVGSL